METEPRMSDEREIIEVEDFRVIDVREEPLDESEPPFAQQPPMQTWSGQTYTTTVRGGGGCCLGFSVTLLLIGLVFVLGVCFLIYLLGRAIGWAIPGL
jgi:hypothetical protein